MNLKDYYIYKEAVLVGKLQEAAKCGDNGAFIKQALSISGGFRAFCTKKGVIRTGPCILKAGDVIRLLPVVTSFVLRPIRDSYLLIGRCYVH